MTNLFKKNIYLVFIFVSCSVAFSTNVISIIRDNFHEGEYLEFLWHMIEYYKGNVKFPLFVHGAIDYAPSLLAYFIYGDGFTIVGTRIVNIMIVAIQWVFFLDFCHTLIPKSQKNSYWILIVLSVFLMMTPHVCSDALVVTQSFLGVRSFFLLFTVWGIGKYLILNEQPRAYIFLVIGSISAVIGLFWCYDRGLIECAFYALVLTAMLLKRRFFCFVISVASAMLCLAWLEKTKIFGSLPENIENITYWIHNAAEVNPYPFDKSHLHGYILVLSLSLATIIFSYAVAAGWSTIKERENPSGLLLVGLIVIQFLLIKADRSYYSSWPSLIILFHIGPRLFPLPEISVPRITNLKPQFVELRRLFLLTVLPITLFLILCSDAVLNSAIFARKMMISSPDREVLTPEITLLGNELRKIGVKSFLGWTNEGVIAYVAKETICTRYPYSHYVTRFSETDMLEQLMKEAPTAIVFDSALESVPTEYREVPQRLPKINEFVLSNYHAQKKINSYIIAIKSAL